MNDHTRRRILTGSAAVALGMIARPAASGDPPAAGSADWIELETAVKETTLDGHRVRLRAYNGQIPGPTMTVVPMVVDGHDVHQIAMDGTNFTAVRTIAARAAGDACEQFDAEERHLVVGASHHGGNEGHPFHIHVNAFEVISMGGVLLPSGTIQDTVWVPTGKIVIIRIKFKQWTGKSVFHCHITPHEDVGMMQNFLILDPLQASHKH